CKSQERIGRRDDHNWSPLIDTGNNSGSRDPWYKAGPQQGGFAGAARPYQKQKRRPDVFCLPQLCDRPLAVTVATEKDRRMIAIDAGIPQKRRAFVFSLPDRFENNAFASKPLPQAQLQLLLKVVRSVKPLIAR